MDNNAKEMQGSACFMCQQAGRGGCLECRTQRLIADIRMQAYEKLGAEQNRSEWEERALSAESERDQARKELEEAQKQMGIWRELYKSCGQYRDENKCAEADAAEQQVRSLQKAARDVLDEHRCLGEQTSLHVSQCPRCRLAALSQRRES